MSRPSLPDDAEVFRLVTRNHEHFPPDAERPHPVAFTLTSADVNEGKARGLPPMLSVFDKSKTTIAEGRAIRTQQAVSAGRPVQETTPFGWTVAQIRAITVPNDKHFPRLSVVADPLDPPEGPGSDGHAGIVGLDGIKKEPDGSAIRNLLRVRLVDTCHRLGED